MSTMQVLAGHHAERAPPGAELFRQPHPGEAEAFAATGKIVALNVFKKGAALPDWDLPGGSEPRDGLPADLATSLLEELQQARFREARRLKRVETLEQEIRVARARNEALRTALESTRCADGDAPAGDAAAAPEPAPAAETVRRRRLGRSLMRLLRKRD